MKNKLSIVITCLGILLLITGLCIYFVDKGKNLTQNSINEDANNTLTNTKYLCKKVGQDITTSSGIVYHIQLKYQFEYDSKVNDITNYVYIVEYHFDKLEDFDEVLELPSLFKDVAYEEGSDSSNLVKTLSYIIKYNFDGLNKQDFINSYIDQFEKDNYVCSSIQ